MITIYKITNPVGNSYIGKTKNLVERLKYYSKRAKHITQPKLQYSLLKYGWTNHTVDILETCDETNGNEREKFWIDKLKTYHHDNPKGLNLTKGGDGGLGGRRALVFAKSVEQRDVQTGELIKVWKLGVPEICKALGVCDRTLYSCINGDLIQSRGYVWCYEGSFKGVKINKTKTKEHSLLLSQRGKELYKSGFVNPQQGKTGKLNAQSKGVYCVELNRYFESVNLAAKYLKENYFPQSKVNALHTIISRNIKENRASKHFNFIYSQC